MGVTREKVKVYRPFEFCQRDIYLNQEQKLFNAFTADMKADKLALKDYLNNK